MNAIHTGAVVPTSIQSQFEVLRVLYAAYRSARENGRAVSVSEA